jgi:hypothetical protein
MYVSQCILSFLVNVFSKLVLLDSLVLLLHYLQLYFVN